MRGGQDIAAKLQAAIAHHRRGDMDDAIPLYAEVVAAHPEHTQALQLLGQACLKRRDLDAAESCFQRVLALEPPNRRAREGLGDVLHRRGQLEAARSAYEACLSHGGDDRQLRDKIAGVDFANEHLLECPRFACRADLLSHALAAAPQDGLTIELGVAGGSSLRFLASQTAGPIYGFDSFAGLPEDWQPSFRTGSFAQARLPANLPPNAHLVIGMFDDTLPAFVAERPEPVRFLHVDCDLYASTKAGFAAFGSRLAAGSVIVFDEFLNYPGWRDHEYRAFCEFIDATGRRFRFIAWIPGGMQVAVRLE